MLNLPIQSAASRIWSLAVYGATLTIGSYSIKLSSLWKPILVILALNQRFGLFPHGSYFTDCLNFTEASPRPFWDRRTVSRDGIYPQRAYSFKKCSRTHTLGEVHPLAAVSGKIHLAYQSPPRTSCPCKHTGDEPGVTICIEICSPCLFKTKEIPRR